MSAYNFIFSNKPKHRLTRHIVLWAIFCLYFFIVNFQPAGPGDFTNSKAYATAFYKMIYIPVSILSAYATAYFLLPRYLLKEKYFRFVILFFGLCIINLISAYWLTKLLALLALKLPFDKLPVTIRIFQPIIYGFGLGTAAGVFAGIVRLLKIHYLRQKENERMEKQKITTELEIIKTHFHPHFLSDSLQNISRLIQNHSTQSPESILKLADLLSYFLYDDEKGSVKLEQEIEIVRSYLELEKIFYGDKIAVNFKEHGEINNVEIAPLIIVSLVQHCCEQSLLALQQKLIIDIEIKMENDWLFFKLSCNGYYESINGTSQYGSDLNQVLKRVQLLYPDRHKIKTHLENGTFSLTLLFKPENNVAKVNDNPEVKFAYDLA